MPGVQVLALQGVRVLVLALQGVQVLALALGLALQGVQVPALQEREQRPVDKLERYDQRAGHEQLHHSASPKNQGHDDHEY